MHNQPPQPTQSPRPASNKPIWILLISFIVVVALVVWGFSALMSMRGGSDRDIIKKGTATQGISSASFFTGPQKIGRAVTTVYKASYRYEVEGKTYSVIGEKDYKSADNLHEGMKATVYYTPDDPGEATVTNEE